MKHEMSDYLCWAQLWTVPSAEQRAHSQELLALLSAGSTARTWAVKGRCGREKEKGKGFFMREGKASSLLEWSTGAGEYMQPSVCQPLSVSSPQVSRTLLPFNSPLVHLPMSDVVHCRSLQPEGLLFDIGI